MKILSQTKICTCRECDVWLQKIQDYSPPNYAEWCVQYAGSGYYFPKYEQAVAYLRKRRFINNKNESEVINK